MFRINKDDYNTVQFLPDCESAGKPRRSSRKQKTAPPVKSKVAKEKKKKTGSGGGGMNHSGGGRRRSGKVLPIILILLVVITIGVWFGYSQYFSPKSQFIRAFNDGDYTRSEEIAQMYKIDPAFKKQIRSTVRGEVDSIMDQYSNSQLVAVKTLDALDLCDDGSAHLFKKYIDDNRLWLDTVETVYYLSDVAATDAKNERYQDCMINLFEIERIAKENGLILDARLTEVLTTYMSGLKPYLFVEYSNTIRNENDYSSILNSCAFVSRYIQDDDFIEYPSVVEKVNTGAMTKIAAAREARAIAKESGANIEINEGSGLS